jgi:hypothetical protein
MPLNVDLANEGGLQIIGDGGEDVAVLQVKTADDVPALIVGRSGAGSQTIGILRVNGSSMASGALLEFKGGFISTTSVVLTTVANTDYAIPVQIGLETRYIPVFKAAAIIGAAAF